MNTPDFTPAVRPDPETWQPNPGERESAYRAPQVVLLGKAAELMRRDSSGHLKDGTGGWWVWGS
jgi:hypothetical protein